MDLTKDGLPTKFSKGNSSLILLDANGKSLYLCIFNAACYKQFQQQAVQMGYKADKADGKSSTLFYMNHHGVASGSAASVPPKDRT